MRMRATFFFVILFTLISLPAFAQTGICGPEEISYGTRGEVRIRSQVGGTDLNYDVCWPKACTPLFSSAQTTVVSDKYTVGSEERFTYQKICFADVESAQLNSCSTLIGSEDERCAPTKCDANFLDAGTFYESRDKSGSKWIENVYRLCLKGNKIENATLIFKEQTGSFPNPESCAEGFNSAGVFKEIHFNNAESYRVWRVCMKLKSQEITTTTISGTTTTASPRTTTTAAPSNLETAKITALANLSAMLNVSATNITVDSAEAVTWSDAALGCPKLGVGYAQATSPGYRIILSYEGKKYYYHSGSEGKSFYCENPKEPVATSSTTTLKPTTTTLKQTSTSATYPPTTSFPTTTFPVPLPSERKSACADSDSGIAIHSAGSVRVENGTLYLDACAENNLINEYYCSNGTASIYIGNCTAGCLNSACRGTGEALAEKGAQLAGRLIDMTNYIIDLLAKGKIIERGIDLVGKVIDTASSTLDVFSKLLGKGSQYVDTIEIANKTGNLTNITTSTT